ncbi:MAG: peptidase S15, partial [Paracoccaceae bacterium]|nr:peptidase S15 [Paracoccaceae bacterium]
IHPDDPSTAQVYIYWEQRLARGDWSVRTCATSTMRAEGNDLILTAKLEAYEGETRVFSRDFSEKVARAQI